MLIFDAHLDLSMNAIEWNRDLTRSIDEIRAREQGRTDKPDRGNGTVCLPEMRKGNVGICVATLIARYVKAGNPLPGYHSPEIAWAITQGQLAWYRAMEESGQMVQIRNSNELRKHVELWKNPPEQAPIGYILSLEGADSILTPGHLARVYEQGLRAVGPAHYGPGTYAQGTHATGGLGPRGRELLAEMDRLGMILDATHLSDDGFWEALDHFQGPVWASHNNCRALVSDTRQFTDEQIKALVARGAVRRYAANHARQLDWVS
ncbi:MAG: membrane dipeptidase [Planctomycetia bacterium]|nr:membrane dipeptidase [Planctomycetia bacterium]